MRKFSVKLTLLLFTLYILHCIFYIPTFAAEATPSAQAIDIGYSRIDPTSPLYFLKTIREDLEIWLALTPRVKMLRKLEFATRRLREAKTLVSKNEDLIPPTLERYSAQLNSLPDQGLEDILITHLETLQQMYNDASDIRAKMFIRSAMNRIIQRADVPKLAKAPICTLFSKEASSSALNQTERVVLAERAQKCLHYLK